MYHETILVRWAFPFVVALLLWTGAPALAQGDAASGDDGAQPQSAKELIQAAYVKTKAAKTVDDYTEVVALCQAALDAGASDAGKKYVTELSAWALNRRGKMYTEQAGQSGDADDAAKLDDMALADFEESVRLDPDKWRALHNRGVSYAQRGEFQKALADFNRTLDLNQQYANAWFNRGEIHYEMGNLDDAIRDYTRAAQLDSQDSEAYRARAHALFRQRRYRSSLEDYNRAVQLAPESAEPLTDRADAYSLLGYWDRAARDYRRAVQLDEKLGRAYMGAAWLMATCPDSRFRDGELAVESAEKAIELDGEGDYRYLDTLAAAQANVGEYEEAKATLGKAIDKAPEDQAERLKARQAMYEKSQPFRDERVADGGQ